MNCSKYFDCWIYQKRHACKPSSSLLKSHGYFLCWVYIQCKHISKLYGCRIIFLACNNKRHCKIIVITHGFGNIG